MAVSSCTLMMSSHSSDVRRLRLFDALHVALAPAVVAGAGVVSVVGDPPSRLVDGDSTALSSHADLQRNSDGELK